MRKHKNEKRGLGIADWGMKNEKREMRFSRSSANRAYIILSEQQCLRPRKIAIIGDSRTSRRVRLKLLPSGRVNVASEVADMVDAP